MSKDQNPTIILTVEIVDNLLQMLSSITNTISFWKLDNKWPTNLIQDTVDEIWNELNQAKEGILKFKSLLL